ncbi:MAG: O-methyltransferase [Clostridia bacterium]|nr:O-methyltransferase [Clostridia bacterium]
MLDETKIEKIKKDARANHVPILQDDSLQFIETLLEIKKPESILEVGTAVGYSALQFSKHLKENGKIVTMELDEATSNIARENIKELGMENIIQVVNSDAYKYMKTLEGPFDVVFIDAAKGQYMKYLEEALRLTRPGSLIIADNVLLRGMVMSDYNEHKHRTAVTRLREYITSVTTNPNLVSCVMNVGDGVAVSVVK